MAWSFRNWFSSKKESNDNNKPVNLSPNDLKNYVVGNSDNNLSQKIQSIYDLSNYQVAAAYSTIYTKVERFRKDVIIEVEKLRDFYLTDVIINQFADDALSPDVISNEILTLYSDRDDIDKELQLLQEKIDFDELAISICPDIIAYGEYTMSVKVEKGVGVVEISDNVEQNKVIPLDKNGEIDGFLVQDGGKLEIHPPSSYIKFALSSKKIRIDLFNEISAMLGTSYNSSQLIKNIPRYIRIGKSILYPVRAKIKELELLEQLVPATKISKLAAGTVVGVSVPGGYSIEHAQELAKKVEGILNKKVGVDSERGQLTLENIMSSAGRLKVVPIIGDKGQLQKFDYKQDEPDDLLNSVDDVRKVICNSVGIPYELIFVSESPSKGDVLRRYARYIRKLKSIQRAIAEGYRQLVYIHLANKDISFVNSDIKIDFKNKLVEIDNLNKLEFLDTTIGMLKNSKEFIQEISSSDSIFNGYIDKKVFMNFVNEQLSIIGLRGLISKEPIKDNDISDLEDTSDIKKPMDTYNEPFNKLPDEPTKSSDTDFIDIEDIPDSGDLDASTKSSDTDFIDIEDIPDSGDLDASTKSSDTDFIDIEDIPDSGDLDTSTKSSDTDDTDFIDIEDIPDSGDLDKEDTK